MCLLHTEPSYSGIKTMQQLFSLLCNKWPAFLFGIAAAFPLSLQGLSGKSCAFIMICEILVIISVFPTLTFFSPQITHGQYIFFYILINAAYFIPIIVYD